jgi:tRNA-2-methylthio-N6-dimethylallyladenosine synthase
MFSVVILGCQYNYHDAKNITHQLKKMGYIYTTNTKCADIIIILSCAVRQKPMDRIFGKINEFKKNNKNIIIVLAGCVLDKDKKRLSKKVDLITNIDNFQQDISKIIKTNNIKTINKKINISTIDFFPKNEVENSVYVPIIQGCNNFCTYCAVPYTRGREISQSPNKIIANIKLALKNNKKHMILLGQNVNSYKYLSGNSNSIIDFTKLLKTIDNINNNFTYNFISPNPRNFPIQLSNFLTISKKWNKHLHLPLQSANDDILKKMNRGYNKSQYLRIVQNLKSKIKNLNLTTDIIVGFPGEKDKHFADTYQICKSLKFTHAYISQYSPREGTFAKKNYEDDVPRSVKYKRWQILNELINKKN